jgi:hydroxyacylglutathione hydrolase
MLIEIAPGLRAVPSRPAWAFNVYVVGGVVVDASTRWAARRLLKALDGVDVHAHAVTHGHFDHQGSSAALCAARGLPFWAPAGEAAAIAAGDLMSLGPVNAVTRLQDRVWAGPPVTAARELREGDELDAGFVVLETPGHSPGHVSFWREEDRTLLAGDVLFGRHPVHGRPGIHEPPERFTLDVAANRRAIRRLADLRPRVVVFGHGRPWRDPDALARLAEALPEERAAAPAAAPAG